MIEIGLVIYPGAQQAAVLVLTDLFGVANRIVTSHKQEPVPALRITHWRQEDFSRSPACVLDSCPGKPPGRLSTLILRPALSEPIGADQVESLTAWHRKRTRQTASHKCATRQV